MRRQAGFALIELMIVLVIIGTLASVAIPTYKNYIQDAANNACILEANIYARKVYTDIQLRKRAIDIPAPIAKACNVINNSEKVVTMTSFVSSARSPGNATITCDLNAGTPCSVTALSP